MPKTVTLYDGLAVTAEQETIERLFTLVWPEDEEDQGRLVRSIHEYLDRD